ncbi:hypothetical protein BDY24DRAFT_443889, partial [Mrakia frigida]|uniref:uncharacterized protein n=1 Tax=Mrakia frigida TaxID=29902 RepID=UPI003FCBFDC0
GGVLTLEGRNGKVGSFVRGLRLGGSGCLLEACSLGSFSFQASKFLSSNCSSLLLPSRASLDSTRYPLLPNIISQLPFTRLSYETALLHRWFLDTCGTDSPLHPLGWTIRLGARSSTS